MAAWRFRCGALVGMMWVVVAVAASQQPPQVQSAGAQQAATTPTGDVTGTVISAENQKPVRFAQVSLQSVDAVAAATASARGNGFRGQAFSRGGQATTEIDGTFHVENVAPGDYYVVASATGFVQERSLLQAAVNGGADPAQLLARIPVVHVVADSSSNVVVTVQRGGVLAGHVAWEDGSAATGVNISATAATQQNTQLPPPLSGLQLNGAGQVTVSDDRGDFRIAGLPSADYLVQAVIQSGGRGFGGRGFQIPATIRVYAPGVFRKSAAKAYSVRAGDERSDVQLVVDVRGLHTVSGHVGSADSSQSVRSGRVSVTDPNDPTLQMLGTIDADGDFNVRYVPPGSYTLQVIGASTQPSGALRGRGGESTTPAVTFRAFSQQITVTDTDLSGVAATLTPESGAR